MATIKKGEKIQHPKYGEGIVILEIPDIPDSLLCGKQIKVSFKSGRKWFPYSEGFIKNYTTKSPKEYRVVYVNHMLKKIIDKFRRSNLDERNHQVLFDKENTKTGESGKTRKRTGNKCGKVACKRALTVLKRSGMDGNPATGLSKN